MPLPTSNTSPVEDAYGRVVATAVSVKSSLDSAAGLIAAGEPLATSYLVNLFNVLNNAQATGLSIQGVTGLTDYARTALNNPSYDINAEFTASILACKAVTDWLLANMPSDGSGGFVGWRHKDAGQIQVVTVSADQLAPLAALIGTALATFA